MRQEVARAHKGWALDSVILHNDVLKLMREEVRAPPAVIKRLNHQLQCSIFLVVNFFLYSIVFRRAFMFTVYT